MTNPLSVHEFRREQDRQQAAHAARIEQRGTPADYASGLLARAERELEAAENALVTRIADREQRALLYADRDVRSFGDRHRIGLGELHRGGGDAA